MLAWDRRSARLNRSTRLKKVGLALAAALGPAGAALAQLADPAIPPADDTPWKLDAEPIVWYVAPAGKLRMPAAPGTPKGQQYELSDLNLDSARMAPAFEVDLRRGRWGVAVDGMTFSASDRSSVQEFGGQIGGVPVAAGDHLNSSLDFSTLAVMGTYQFYEYQHDPAQDGGWKLDSTLRAVLGGRIYDVDFDISGPGGSTHSDEFFAEPVAGVRWRFDIGEQFTIGLDLRAGYGPWGDRTSWSFDIAPKFQWRPIEHVGVEIGYRLLVTDLQTGNDEQEFDWRGSMAGVYFGIVVRF